MDADEYISVWIGQTEPISRSALPLAKEIVSSVVKVNTEIFAKNLSSFLSKVQMVLNSVSVETSAYAVEEVELHLMLNGSGGIELVGNLQAGVQSGIKVRLKRG